MVKVRNFINQLISEKEMKATTLRALSLVFLAIACSIAFVPFERERLFFFNAELSIMPDFISTMFAILLIAPLYARKILKWNGSIYTIISLLLFLLFFSSLIELFLGGGDLLDVPINMLLVTAIALSWLGIKEVAGLAWIILFVGIGFKVSINSYTMGFWGFLYIGSAFIGLVLHSGLNPGQLISSFKHQFKAHDTVKEAISSDISEAVEVADNNNKISEHNIIK